MKKDGWAKTAIGGLSTEASRDEARDECCRRGESESLDSKCCRLGEGESPEANPIRLGEEAKPLGERESLEERGLGEGESLERDLLLQLGPASEANPIRFGEGDPLEANPIRC